jgi:FixJ family two-component response regulator
VAESPVISIVDDDLSVREGIVDLVRAMGFKTLAFERAKHFLQSSRLDETSCLITDVAMPGMSGLQLHDHLVASGKRIPTIIITAFPAEADRRRAKQAGVLCYLAKPFDDTELAECIRSAVGPAGRGQGVS